MVCSRSIDRIYCSKIRLSLHALAAAAAHSCFELVHALCYQGYSAGLKKWVTSVHYLQLKSVLYVTG